MVAVVADTLERQSLQASFDQWLRRLFDQAHAGCKRRLTNEWLRWLSTLWKDRAPVLGNSPDTLERQSLQASFDQWLRRLFDQAYAGCKRCLTNQWLRWLSTLWKDRACRHRLTNGCGVCSTKLMLVTDVVAPINGCGGCRHSGKTELQCWVGALTLWKDRAPVLA